MLLKGPGIDDPFTGIDPAGDMPFSYTAPDTYQGLGYSDETASASGGYQFTNATQINAPLVAPTGVQAKLVAGDNTKARITYTPPAGSNGETYSLDGGQTWSNPSAAGGLLQSGSVVSRAAASTILLRPMNAADDFGTPWNPGAATAAVAITA